VSTYLLPVYKLYKYHSVGFSTILHHVANSWELIIYTQTKDLFQPFVYLHLTFQHTICTQSPPKTLQIKRFVFSLI